MLVKDLIKILKKHNSNNQVIFYNLENYNLIEFNLETIIDCDGRTEITTTNENLE